MAKFNSPDFFGEPASIEDVKRWMRDHLARQSAAGVDISNESIGIYLDLKDIKTLIDGYGATSLVAFFGVERGSQTVILMGMNGPDSFIKGRNPSTGEMTYVAIERWGKFNKVSASSVLANPNTLDTLFP